MEYLLLLSLLVLTESERDTERDGETERDRGRGRKRGRRTDRQTQKYTCTCIQMYLAEAVASALSRCSYLYLWVKV